MAKTGLTTSSNETKKLWEEQLFRDAVKQSYFARFMGGSESIVHVKSDLEKGKGDRIRFTIRMRLSGSGVGEGETLEGNEENLTTYTFDLDLVQLRHAVRDDGAMSRQRAVYDISAESRMALQDWITEQIDQKCFNALQSSPTKAMYGGDATSDATIEAADLLTPALISKVKTWALTGGNRSQTPLRPVNIEGKKHYVMVIHPDQAYDLKTNSDWESAQQYANVRGMSNPLFTGALGMWDNVIIHEHENVTLSTTLGAGSNVAGAKAIFMGAQALVWGWGQRPEVVQKKFDFDNEMAYATGMIYGVEKPVFNSLDYGSISVVTSRTQISDA